MDFASLINLNAEESEEEVSPFTPPPPKGQEMSVSEEPSFRDSPTPPLISQPVVKSPQQPPTKSIFSSPPPATLNIRVPPSFYGTQPQIQQPTNQMYVPPPSNTPNSQKTVPQAPISVPKPTTQGPLFFQPQYQNFGDPQQLATLPPTNVVKKTGMGGQSPYFQNIFVPSPTMPNITSQQLGGGVNEPPKVRPPQPSQPLFFGGMTPPPPPIGGELGHNLSPQQQQTRKPEMEAPPITTKFGPPPATSSFDNFELLPPTTTTNVAPTTPKFFMPNMPSDDNQKLSEINTNLNKPQQQQFPKINRVYTPQPPLFNDPFINSNPMSLPATPTTLKMPQQQTTINNNQNFIAPNYNKNNSNVIFTPTIDNMQPQLTNTPINYNRVSAVPPSFDNYQQTPISQQTTIPQQKTTFFIEEEDIFNQSCIKPRPIVAFGGGGKLYTMFPQKIPRLNVLESTKNDPYNVPGLIKEHKILNILESFNENDETIQDMRNYNSNSIDKLMEFVHQKMQKTFESKFNENNSNSKKNENKYLLWALLKIFLQRNSSPSSNEQEIEEYNEQQLSETVLKVLVLLGSENLKQFFETEDIPIQNDVVRTQHCENDISVIKEIENKLLLGDIEGACDVGVLWGYWGHALILASMIKKKKFEEVVAAFTAREVDGSGASSAISTLYYTFANRPQYIINQSFPTQPSSSSSNDYPAIGVEDEITRKNRKMELLAREWKNNVSILLTNIVSGKANSNSPTQDTIYNIAELLLKKKKNIFAHFCYGVGEFLFTTGKKQTGFQLLGENSKRSYYNGGKNYSFSNDITMENIRLTEIYEFAKQKLYNAGNPSKPRHLSVEFQGYRLIYAHWLFEMGLIEQCNEMFESILNVLKLTKDHIRYNRYFTYHLNVLRYRLSTTERKNSTGAPQGGIPPNSANGNGVTGWLLKSIDNSINRIIHGKEDNLNVPQTQPNQVPQQQQQSQILQQSQSSNLNMNATSSISFDNQYQQQPQRYEEGGRPQTPTQQQRQQQQQQQLQSQTKKIETISPNPERQEKRPQQSQQDASGGGGWLGWIFGKQSMNIGKKNAYKWSEEYQLWYREGEEDPKDKAEKMKGPPPPTQQENENKYLQSPNLSSSPNISPSPTPNIEEVAAPPMAGGMSAGLSERYVDTGFGVAPVASGAGSDKSSLLATDNDLLNFGLQSESSGVASPPINLNFGNFDPIQNENNDNNVGGGAGAGFGFFIPSQNESGNENDQNSNEGFSFSQNMSFMNQNPEQNNQ